MKIIKRKMVVDEQVTTADHNIDEYLPHCQASFNSDGNITLKNYDRSNKDKDEIIILSKLYYPKAKQKPYLLCSVG